MWRADRLPTLGAARARRAARTGAEERRARLIRQRQPLTSSPVCLEGGAQIGADRDQARLEELGVPDCEDPIGQIDVTAPEPKRFAGAQSGAVERREWPPAGLS